MSSDSWAVCPQCKKRAMARKQKQIEAAREGYGKLSPEGYDAMLLTSRKPIDLDGENLREDYEFQIKDDGTFVASYSARCDRCGFKHEFSHSELVNLD